MSGAANKGLLAIFTDVSATAQCIRALHKEGFANLTVYAPTPRHEITDALDEAADDATSPVRLWTLAGALTGLAIGFAMPIWMSLDWPLRTSGKAIVSLPAFVIIVFELTILLGALGAVTGFFFHARLPQLPHQMVHHDPRFSNDRFGVFVAAGERTDAAKMILQSAGAEEVRDEES